ncbi:family 1 encapsulin nanocompartment shell protein [Thermotoga caldifontis]|uniref:family 1 encapsulin nanocompartment shell protein n=1 Tax=Thermotoga caldifontis TaxID=1508419 RepID=UPI000596CA17|nr:family 1 encapsulin nanocompartment shell protein [Thermotoga caldifontis]
MANRYLMQEEAPISEELWKLLNESMLELAKANLTGRKILNLVGPLGVGVKQVSLADEKLENGVFVSKSLPLYYVHRTFELSVRDIAAFEREKVAIDLSDFTRAVLECVQFEEKLIFHGIADQKGLLSLAGVEVNLSDWKKVGQAVEDVITAITKLDEAGFHGPYLLALSPDRYNKLFRRYENGNQTEMEHLLTMVKKIYKAPILQNSGVLICDSPLYASLILGQDLSIGFIGPKDHALEFYVSESLTLLVKEPNSICALRG